MKKLMSLAMLVLVLGASATTVIPKASQPVTAAQTTPLSDEQLNGVSGGSYTCKCGSWGNGSGSFVTCDGEGSIFELIFAMVNCS